MIRVANISLIIQFRPKSIVANDQLYARMVTIYLSNYSMREQPSSSTIF